MVEVLRGVEPDHSCIVVVVVVVVVEDQYMYDARGTPRLVLYMCTITHII